MVTVLLKSLFRRQRRDQEKSAGSSPERGNDILLTKHLTYTSEYHLLRLQKLLELRYHRHFTITEDTALRDMIHFASGLQEPDIQRELLLFYLNCPPKVQVFLRSGELLEANHYLRQGNPPTDA